MRLNFIKSFLIFSSMYVLSIFGQDCLLQVPADPLNNGLFQPWFVSTKVGSAVNCSQLNPKANSFVEATIVDATTGQLFVYYPLVLDVGMTPVIPILRATLPTNNIVVIHFGTNGNTLTLIPTKDKSSSLDSMHNGNCINGLPGGMIFGQFAYCNAINFFRVVNQLIIAGKINPPPLQNSRLGDICPTTRSFAVVDQDQSDNVLSQYLVINGNIIAQDYPLNSGNYRNISFLNSVVDANGSDNRLLDVFIYGAIGCFSFQAPDLAINGLMRSSLALNEILANQFTVPTSLTTALVPSLNPMVLENGNRSLTKINLYRSGVNQPILLALNIQDDINYCNQLAAIAVPFFTLHQTELMNFASPMAMVASNLLNFLANRLFQSWTNLNCIVLTGLPSPVTVTVDPNTMIVIANSITGLPATTINPYAIPTTTVNPYSVPTSTAAPVTPSNTSKLTSVSLPTNVSTTIGGPMTPSTSSTPTAPAYPSTTIVATTLTTPGMSSSMMSPTTQTGLSTTGLSSTAMLSTTIPTSANSMINLCGSSAFNVNCTEFCPNGLNSECMTPGFTCFNVKSNDLALCNFNNFCGSNGAIDCMMPCSLGLDSQCTTIGSTCLKITTNFCNQVPSTMTTTLQMLTTIPMNMTQDNMTTIPVPTSGVSSRNDEFYVHIFHLLIVIGAFFV
jgi:hypothetical protein